MILLKLIVLMILMLEGETTDSDSEKTTESNSEKATGSDSEKATDSKKTTGSESKSNPATGAIHFLFLIRNSLETISISPLIFAQISSIIS